jgi:hypothetical protein
MWSTS